MRKVKKGKAVKVIDGGFENKEAPAPVRRISDADLEIHRQVIMQEQAAIAVKSFWMEQLSRRYLTQGERAIITPDGRIVSPDAE